MGVKGAGAWWDVLWKDRCFRSVLPVSEEGSRAERVRSRLVLAPAKGKIPGGDGRGRDVSTPALTGLGIWVFWVGLLAGGGTGPLALLSLCEPVDNLKLLPRRGTALSTPTATGNVSSMRLG